MIETALFQGSTDEEIEGMLGCLGMRKRRYSAGERIHRMGERICEVGLVLEGRMPEPRPHIRRLTAPPVNVLPVRKKSYG